MQAEFAKERKQLATYIREDALLADFFDVFLFEEQPARSCPAQSVFLGEVKKCDVYLGLFGGMYAGGRGTAAISPTEQEYDLAKKLGKTMLGFVRTGVRREKREAAFIREKVDADLSRNPFANFDELKVAVYKSLVALLKEQDEISNRPFDQSFSRHVKMSDLDEEKFRDFRKRINPDKKTLETETTNEDILAKIGAFDRATGRISNGALLLFAKHPHEFKTSWAIRCLHFYGFDVEKPTPSLHTYTGTVFDLVDQAVDFVMSRADLAVEAPVVDARARTRSEFPIKAVREAIVNAVCHRDYRSNASVQVMLFRDRLEVLNPGSLPKGTVLEDLYRIHESNPRNEVIAEAMSWTDYVERSGYGTREILSQCRERGLSRPIFEPSTGSFRVVLWRNGYGPDSPKDRTLSSSGGPGVVQSGGPVVVQSWSSRIVAVVRRSKEVSTTDIVKALGLKATNGSIKRALKSLIDDKIVEYTIPEKPNSRLQKYRLTAKGRAIIPMGLNL